MRQHLGMKRSTQRGRGVVQLKTSPRGCTVTIGKGRLPVSVA